MKAIFFVSLFVSFSFVALGQKHQTKLAPVLGVTVEVEGGKALKMMAPDLAKLPRIEVKAKDHDGVERTFSGYELRHLLSLGGAKLGKDLKGPAIAQFLIVEAADGYHAVYSLTELDPDFSDKLVILADTQDGKPLPEANGPWQVIATNEKKHDRWVRQVTALKVRMAK